MALAGPRNIKVIEDCAQAHGAAIDSRMVGSFGAAGAWSFCLDKIMTTGGEGGMVTTDDPALWSRMWTYKHPGKSSEAVSRRAHPTGSRWVKDSIGKKVRIVGVQEENGSIHN